MPPDLQGVAPCCTGRPLTALGDVQDRPAPGPVDQCPWRTQKAPEKNRLPGWADSSAAFCGSKLGSSCCRNHGWPPTNVNVHSANSAKGKPAAHDATGAHAVGGQLIQAHAVPKSVQVSNHLQATCLPQVASSRICAGDAV